LLAFTDASKKIYGAVIYLQDLTTGILRFMFSKNRLISKRLMSKTVPVLELLAMNFGAQCLVDYKNELLNAFFPIKIKELHVFSVSTISLNWLNSKVHKFLKIERHY
jgi:hypothetical protein